MKYEVQCQGGWSFHIEADYWRADDECAYFDFYASSTDPEAPLAARVKATVMTGELLWIREVQ